MAYMGFTTTYIENEFNQYPEAFVDSIYALEFIGAIILMIFVLLNSYHYGIKQRRLNGYLLVLFYLFALILLVGCLVQCVVACVFNWAYSEFRNDNLAPIDEGII